MIMISSETIRPGELSVLLPERTDAGVYFVGRIRTPGQTAQIARVGAIPMQGKCAGSRSIRGFRRPLKG
jgi:hypothetical protein